jgi:hypothetical protein
LALCGFVEKACDYAFNDGVGVIVAGLDLDAIFFCVFGQLASNFFGGVHGLLVDLELSAEAFATFSLFDVGVSDGEVDESDEVAFFGTQLLFILDDNS